MGRTALQEKSRWNDLLKVGLNCFTADWMQRFRPDWLSDGKSVHLYKIEKLFTQGLLLGLVEDFESLRQLDIDNWSGGVVMEGAAMGMAMLDLLVPASNNRWQFLSEHNGAPHA